MFKPNHTYFDLHPASFRFVISVFALLAVGIAGLRFYLFASSPTDENLFTYAPTNVSFKENIPAQPVLQNKDIVAVYNGIHEGDLLLRINGQLATTMESGKKILGELRGEDTVSVTLVRNPGRMRREYRAPKAFIENSLQPLVFGAYVIDVTENGASDRAGMKQGDLIVKINGRSFKDIFEADRIMRSAQADKSIEYQILRSGRPVTLYVTLARFGVKFFQVSFFLYGVILWATGLFLALKQPREKAIRLLAMAFILVGCGVAGLLNRNAFYQTSFQLFISIVPIIGRI